MSRSMKNWLAGIVAALVTALLVGVGATFASDHDKVTEMYQTLPRMERKIDALACYIMQVDCQK